MQKTFSKYTIAIISTAIFIILMINFWLMARSATSQQLQTFRVKLEQVIRTMENNQKELNAIFENLNEDYLTRAKAAAYVLEMDEEVLNSTAELRRLAELLDVDEIHVINEKGIIEHSSVEKYIGLNFHDGAQTREFLSILESDNPDTFLVQDAQPNTAEGKLMKYVGVSRKGKKGIVQVGLEPVRQIEAQQRNTYEYIFSLFPTDVGEMYFTVDCLTNELITHTGGVPEDSCNHYHQMQNLKQCENGAFLKMEDGIWRYVVTCRYGDVLIGASIPRSIMFKDLKWSTLRMLLCLLLVELLVICMLNYLVKRKVVDGVHELLKGLSSITNGNLDTSVQVKGNRELEELSAGINTMVKSIVNGSDRIARIIAISGIPLAAFEYRDSMKNVFITSGLREMLEIPAEQMEQLCLDGEQFRRRIEELMQKKTEEKDIFQISESRYVQLHLSTEADGYMGVVTDVTKDMMEKRIIQYDNNHDQLTGLRRYRYFKKQASELLRTMPAGKICAFVMIDLDNFKDINDTYGHDVGDVYLQSFAAALSKLPENHCLTSRRSGDEFSIMIYDYRSIDKITALLEEFWKSLERMPVRLTEDCSRVIRASGGFVCTGHAEIELTVLLNQADEALYKTKEGKKGYFTEYKAEQKL